MAFNSKKTKRGQETQRLSFRLLTRLRNYFLTGLVVIGPLVITAYLAWTIFGWADSWFKPYVEGIYFPGTDLSIGLPGFGVVISIVFLTLVGALTTNIVIGRMFSLGERIVDRMPLVRNIYNGLKQIFVTVLSKRGTSFSKAGLIEYPRKGLWAIAFISTPAKGELEDKLGGETEFVSVFLPTTPNPTSGFLLFVPKKDIIVLDMSVEDAAKLVISAGLVSPEYQNETQRLANESKSSESKAGNSEVQT